MRLTVGLVLGATVLIGCATNRAVPMHESVASTGDRSVLAGLWDYEEGTVIVVLTLDEAGNGEYLYKGGRFETVSLRERLWRGRWLQGENDREGEFQVTLTEDFTRGEGRWWYTRIGSDRSPHVPGGGTFHISRSDNTPPKKTIITRPKGETHGE